MIYVDNPELWYNLQIYFRVNIIPDLENDDKTWSREFRRWLKEQGADIEFVMGRRLLRNGLGIAPHYDRLVFDNERDATMFILRWS